MKKNIGKYSCYATLTASILVTMFASFACSSPEMPKMTVSYGPEIGFADGNVNLSGQEPNINISDIKAEVGMNIDYLSGVNIQNEEDFADLEIRVDASMVDIFTPGNYTVVYTFLFDDNMLSKEITVSLFEGEQSASESKSETTTKHLASDNTTNQETSTTVSTQNNDVTASTTKPTSNSNSGTTKPTASSNSSTTNSSSSGIKPTTSSSSSTTKPTTNNNPTTTGSKVTSSNTSTTKSEETSSTTREIITTTGNHTTELKNIGNYTIELLSGKNITIKNTTNRYIVSTRTDVEVVEENGCTYRISKLIITYNTGFGQILETIKDRIK